MDYAPKVVINQRQLHVMLISGIALTMNITFSQSEFRSTSAVTMISIRMSKHMMNMYLILIKGHLLIQQNLIKHKMSITIHN